jgi:DNA-binding response OmpR family regulator
MRIAYKAALASAGYQVLVARDGLEALTLAAREKPALILLDVDMPGLNGWQTLEQLREREHRPPVIMLTGLTEVDDRVRGLSGGAEDYLCKPCDLRELLARVHTVLRRGEPVETGPRLLQFGTVTVDVTNRVATRGGASVELTRTEFEILELFARHPGQLVTRDRMLEVVWGYKKRSNTRTVDTHIWRLRHKLDDNGDEPRWIQTVPAGDGYRMVADAATVCAGTAG